MVRSAWENVAHMEKNTGGAKSRVAGVENTLIHCGTTALLRQSRILDLRTLPLREKPEPGTTSPARMLVRGWVRITSGATPWKLTAGITAVLKLHLQSP